MGLCRFTLLIYPAVQQVAVVRHYIVSTPSWTLKKKIPAALVPGMERKWEEVFFFLSVGAYPSGYNKSQRLNLRRYSSRFTLKEGQLFFGSRRAIKTREEARMLFMEFHSPAAGSHSGIVKTRSALCSRFYWHGMTIDVHNWVTDVWELVGIDVSGPFPRTADGYQFILTATDYFSKWVEAFPLKTKSATEVGRHVCSLIYRHGCPKRILSDQGGEFVPDLNHRLCGLLGIKRSVLASYHPHTNSLDEKTHENTQRALTELITEKQNNWDVFLDAMLFSLRCKVHTATKHSPFHLMYGREAVSPSQVPADVTLSSITLPEESTYAALSDAKNPDGD